jgi:aerobic-type carbon monoxide dehydrogenase small subunit (CoxS/CutS family)
MRETSAKSEAPDPVKGPAGKASKARRPRKVMMTLHVNGEDHDVAFAPHKTLLEVLREDMALTGTKHGCELGECGTCTVIVDGEPVLSCLMLGLECDGHDIVTVEGLATAKGPHPLQTAYADLNAAQCGYCTPGFLCASKALLDRDASPSRDTIKDALSGNLCRCTGYLKIFEAVERAAAELRGEPLPPIDGNEEPSASAKDAGVRRG